MADDLLSIKEAFELNRHQTFREDRHEAESAKKQRNRERKLSVALQAASHYCNPYYDMTAQ